MYTRQIYLERIQPFIGKPVIKILTGMRRTGKSFFMRQIISDLRASGTPDAAILYIDKESLDFDAIRDYRALNEFVKQRLAHLPGQKFVFIDEVQEITEWERAAASLQGEGFDLYLSGSNAKLLSSELSTLLSGRFIEFHIYGLGFKEFLQFRDKKRGDDQTEFGLFLKYGGFPAIHAFDSLDETVVYQYIQSIYNTILIKDIIKRNNVRNVYLLENVMRFVCDNIGNIISSRSIAEYLKGQRQHLGVTTVQNHLSYCTSSCAVHKVLRWDIRGKRHLEMHEKYYLGDIGLRYALLGYRQDPLGGILENIVYLELVRRGYAVSIGKLDSLEVDFIAERENHRVYVQVAYLLASPETVAREIAPFKKLDDKYPCFLLTMDRDYPDDIQGVRRMHVADFLLDETALQRK
ncbi:MAG: ATP-binding protein [Chitinivibrionales bacterium]|nr:ATP-binding protein [Chitinivibrionales bacterium]